MIVHSGSLAINGSMAIKSVVRDTAGTEEDALVLESVRSEKYSTKDIAMVGT